MITVAKVQQYINDVTSEQIGKCTRIYDFQTKEWFYIVESESDATAEYHVRYSRERGFTCSCKSGKCGFANVRHASGVCKHVRWSLAAAQEERAASAHIAAESAKESAAHVLTVGDKPADAETLNRVLSAKPKKVDNRAKPRQPKAFSLLR